MGARGPVFDIDPDAFRADPYPVLRTLRADMPVAFVPQLGAWLITRRDDIFREEKRIEVFSSDQPEGLMTRLMGQNMMRRDGDAHQAERRAIFPSVSPRTVRDVWTAAFADATEAVLDRIEGRGRADLVRDYAMPVSAEALKAVTGLPNMDWQEMDRVSQGMIDGCANYAGHPETEARCHDCTASIDRHIDAMLAAGDGPEFGLVEVQRRAGLSGAQLRANVKLAISGGQNEPRDAIAGAAYALLAHPDQRALIAEGAATWRDAFEEYARWMSPIGMSPRELRAPCTLHGADMQVGDRVFLMFGSGNRDERVFEAPDAFDMRQDCSKALSFGAGPHFCAGAAISRVLIGDIALPRLFARLPSLRLDGEVRFDGWAFRGPVSVPVRWEVG
ncbi:cytochrome P450 [Pseudaestuariivita atlantica]|uniref:Cytochrome P450 n=2 Tax=Pseudaestuariivita atlantica TaxID=1317121 RepID=A0A0L1JQX6_9RHOB|nr:cytochrome P450 [Pseudaestuariivita atlantica]KNG94194.1 cytochrome P450 [Pseudaestuariivita atlantica]